MASVRLFKIFGIDVKVHYSLFLILLILVWVFYIQEFPYGFRGREYALQLSVIASISLFISVFLHELGHSLVSKRFGYNVKEIILFIFGGVAVLERQPRGLQELAVSITGPVVSLSIAGIFYLLSFSSNQILADFSAIFFRINAIIAIFNLIPAFPLDGGRVLRGFLSRYYSPDKSTFIASETGKAIAIFMGVFGLFYNLWLTILAIFIYLGANEEEKMTRLESMLGRLKARDIMTADLKTVSPYMTVGEFMEFAFKTKHLGYPVVENGELVGMITIHDVAGKPEGILLKDLMSRDLLTVNPDTPAVEVFRLMNETGLGRIPVTENGNLVGIITKTDLVRLMQIQEVLRIGRE